MGHWCPAIRFKFQTLITLSFTIWGTTNHKDWVIVGSSHFSPFNFFKRRAFNTIFGVTKPHMGDNTNFHPKSYVFIPKLMLHPLGKSAYYDIIFLKSYNTDRSLNSKTMVGSQRSQKMQPKMVHNQVIKPETRVVVESIVNKQVVSWGRTYRIPKCSDTHI